MICTRHPKLIYCHFEKYSLQSHTSLGLYKMIVYSRDTNRIMRSALAAYALLPKGIIEGYYDLALEITTISHTSVYSHWVLYFTPSLLRRIVICYVVLTRGRLHLLTDWHVRSHQQVGADTRHMHRPSRIVDQADIAVAVQSLSYGAPISDFRLPGCIAV